MIVKLPNGKFVNLANMSFCEPTTKLRNAENGAKIGITVFWAYPAGPEDDSYTRFYNADAQAIIDALESAAEALYRSYL